MRQRRQHQPRSGTRTRRLESRPRQVGSARTWEHYRLDLVNGQSDAPRIPNHQLDRLYPHGAPLSWDLLVQEPQSPAWARRSATGLIGLVLGGAAVMSDTAAGLVSTTLVGFGERAALAGHVLGLLDLDGSWGVASRAGALVAIAIPLARLSWRAARWGAAPIGDHR